MLRFCDTHNAVYLYENNSILEIGTFVTLLLICPPTLENILKVLPCGACWWARKKEKRTWSATLIMLN